MSHPKGLFSRKKLPRGKEMSQPKGLFSRGKNDLGGKKHTLRAYFPEKEMAYGEKEVSHPKGLFSRKNK
jgi:hypothetical protein